MSQPHKHLVTSLYFRQDIFRFIFPGLSLHIASSAMCKLKSLFWHKNLIFIIFQKIPEDYVHNNCQGHNFHKHEAILEIRQCLVVISDQEIRIRYRAAGLVQPGTA